MTIIIMKNKNLLIWVWAGVSLILMIVGFLYYKNWLSKNQDYNMLANDNKSLLDYNAKLDLPIEYAWCKKDLDILNCILKVDEKVWKENPIALLDKDTLANKLDKLEELEWRLGKNQIAIMEKISSDVQDVYVNRKPWIIFESAPCDTRFCKKILSDSKRLIVQEMFVRNLITKKSTCEKIPEQEIKDYCNAEFDKRNW